MSDYDDKLQTESWLAYFRRKNRFADVMLTAWSNIEYSVDMLFTNEFGLSLDDDKAKILLRMNFLTKLDFLKDYHLVTDTEYQAIRSFDRFRNQVFHRDGWVYVHLSATERDNAMDTAVEVVGMLTNAIKRRGSRTNPSVIRGQP
jgi:hypothetical protein